MIITKNTQAALALEVACLRDAQVSNAHNHEYSSISMKLEELGEIHAQTMQLGMEIGSPASQTSDRETQDGEKEGHDHANDQITNGVGENALEDPETSSARNYSEDNQDVHDNGKSIMTY